MPIKLVSVRRFGDERGWFAETYSEAGYAQRGITDKFVQDNQSFSAQPGTIRGLHLQVPPHAQAKLVSCIRGAILDVAVDLRRGSPTYGRWVSAELSAENGSQLFIPVGFGHGFVTLEPDSQVSYKVSDFYAPQAEGGIRWDDPAIGIPWPLPASGPVLSPKDQILPLLADFQSPFTYDGQPLELVRV